HDFQRRAFECLDLLARPALEQRHRLVHMTMLRPARIEGRRLVRNLDVVGERGDNLLVPEAFDEAGHVFSCAGGATILVAPHRGATMYYATVLLLTLILPAGSVYAEQALAHSVLPLMLLGEKWFAFWAGGVRLLIEGIRQQIRPRATSEGIFGIASDDPL